MPHGRFHSKSHLGLLRRFSVHSPFTQRPPMGHVVNSKAEEILDKEFKCLNAGFVRLVDYMGGDESIVQAARVSYGRGTKTVNEDRGLIRYLMRHMHTTPFEMVELKFHVKLPIFVARQWIRHRTANVNEYSGRYSVMKDEFYVPEPEAIHRQSRRNKQGRANEEMPEGLRKKIIEILGSAQRGTKISSTFLRSSSLTSSFARPRFLRRSEKQTSETHYRPP